MSGRHPRHVVLVGGLTDGLLFAKYVAPLAAQLEARQWSLVQTLLSSSHTGYGLASLDQDARELRQLAAHLKAEYGSQVRPRQPGAWAVAPPVGAPTLPLLMCAPSAWHRRAW